MQSSCCVAPFASPSRPRSRAGATNGERRSFGRGVREAGVTPDERVTEAIGVVESKGDIVGRWPLERAYHDQLPVDLGEHAGEPSRWITLRALRVLRWAGKGDRLL